MSTQNEPQINTQITNREKKAFSVISRAKSFAHAKRGLGIFLRSTHNAWIHLAFLIVAIVLGVYFNIHPIEWLFIVLAAGMVLAAEAFNTAIEIHMDLTSPGHHPYARDTKDVAAAAVLITALAAAIVGIIIFGPRIVGLWN